MKFLYSFIFVFFIGVVGAQENDNVDIVTKAATKIVELRDSINHLNTIIGEYEIINKNYKIVTSLDSIEIVMLQKELNATNNIVAKYESNTKATWYKSSEAKFVQGFVFAVAAIFTAGKLVKP